MGAPQVHAIRTSIAGLIFSERRERLLDVNAHRYRVSQIKRCCSCRRAIVEPWLDSGEAERCDACADVAGCDECGYNEHASDPNEIGSGHDGCCSQHRDNQRGAW
jgi:hypothetical protein